MTTLQKIVKYLSLALALALAFSIIAAFASLLGGIFTKNDILGEMVKTRVDGYIENIDINIDAASLRLDIGDEFSVSTNIKNVHVSTDGTTLSVKQKSKSLIHRTDDVGEIIITVPVGIMFKSFDMDIGAGIVEIGRVDCQHADIDIGGGEIKIGVLNATVDADIDAGAGKLSIFGGSIRNADIDLGAGQAAISAALLGECDVQCGVGECNISALGGISDYTLRIETGIGAVIVNGSEAGRDQILGTGPNHLRVNGGIGRIYINI